MTDRQRGVGLLALLFSAIALPVVFVLHSLCLGCEVPNDQTEYIDVNEEGTPIGTPFIFGAVRSPAVIRSPAVPRVITSTPRPTATRTLTPLLSPTITPTPTRTLTVTASLTATRTATFTATGTATVTDTPTITPTPPFTVTPNVLTSTPSFTPTITATPTLTQTPANTATITPTSGTGPLSSTCTTIPGSTSLPSGTANGLSPAASLVLTATFNTIGVELLYTNDANQNAVAGLEFKPSSASSWRCGLPLWRTVETRYPGNGFYGAALLLDPATSYDVRVTVADADGVVGPTTLTSTISTKTDAIASASALTPTRYVSTSGSDGANGLTSGTAWRTIDFAWRNAPSGAIVQVGPGHFNASPQVRTLPITLMAQFPALDDNRNIINVGNHTVIEPLGVSSPTGSGGPNAGVWTQVVLTGPGFGGATPGATYTVWKWTGSPVSGTTQLGYAATRDALPQRVADWSWGRDDLSTPAGWVEKVHTNLSYNYGFAAFGNDIYVRMQGDTNPNTLYMTAGSSDAALTIGGPNARVSGLEIRGMDYGLVTESGASFAVLDHNLFDSMYMPIRMNGARTVPASYGHDHVIQYNRFQDHNLWSADQSGAPSIPWTFIKFTITNANGSVYGGFHIAHQSEVQSISGLGGAKNVVVRYNTVDGPMNGFEGGFTVDTDFDRYAASNYDYYGNFITHTIDDAFDGGQGQNTRIWNNQTDYTLTFLASPTVYGPAFIFRNSIGHNGTTGTAREGDETQYRVSGVGFKYSGASISGRIWVINNTFWTDYGSGGNTGVSGGALFAQDDGSPEWFYLRNNIFRETRAGFAIPQIAGRWNEDYNYFGTTDASQGMRSGATAYSDPVAYRLAFPGQGVHTNLSGNFITVPTLNDPTNGDFTLPVGSALIDAGVPVANIADWPGVNFVGSAPDLGYSEFLGPPGTPTVTPTRTQTPTSTSTSTVTPTATVTPVPILKDLFTDANGTSLIAHVPDTGPAWVAIAGSASISSNQAQGAASTSSALVMDSGQSDVTVKADLTIPNHTFYISGIVLRNTDASNLWEVVIARFNGIPFIGIYEVVGGSSTLRASTNAPNATNSTATLTVTASGSTITGVLSTGESATWSSATSNQTATKHGVVFYQPGSFNVAPGVLIDNFYVFGDGAAFVNRSSETTGTNATQNGTFTLTSPVVLNVPNPAIVLRTAEYAATSHITGITYGGVSLTRTGSASSTNLTASIWTLIGPTPGAAALAISGNGVNSFAYAFNVVYNASQSSPYTAVASDVVDGYSPSASVVTGGASGVVILDMLGVQGTVTADSTAPSQTRQDQTGGCSGTNCDYESYGKPSSSPQTWGWAVDTDYNTDHVYIAVGVKP